MKRLCLLFVLLVISTSVFGYVSVTHETEPLEARVCSLGYYAIVYDGYELTFPPMDTPCPYSSGQSFILSLDGDEYRQDYSSGTHEIGLNGYWESTEEGYDSDTSRAIITTWRIDFADGDIVVRQILAPVTLDSLYLVRIKYEVENLRSMSHDIGLRNIIDPLINGADDLGFSVDGHRTDVGVFFDTSIPEYWGAEDLHRPIFYSVGKNDVYCDQFAIGSSFCLTEPSAGVNVAGYDFESDCWIGQPIFDGCVSSRWNPTVLASDSVIEYTTYYGIGRAYVPPVPGPSIVMISDINAVSSDCAIDSIQDFGLIITNGYYLTDGVELCYTFNASSEITLEGGADTVCTMLDLMGSYEVTTYVSEFFIPSGYSDTESIFDTLYIWTNSFDSLIVDDMFTYEYCTPYIEGLPPEVDFATRDIDYINCAHDFELNITDSDTTANTTDMRISINGESYGSYTGLFTSDSLVTNIHIDSMVVTSEGDTLRFYEDDTDFPGRTIYCVEYLTDMFGCETDNLCDTFYFDYEAPVIESVFPPRAYTLTPGSGIIEITLSDNLSGIDTTTLSLSINDSRYTLTDSELSWDRDYNILRFTPTSEYEDSVLIVCLHDIQDLVDECSPNIMPDTCWYYFYDSDGPVEYSVTIHTIHSDDTPYESLNVTWESSGLITESGTVTTDTDGYHTLTVSASDVYTLTPDVPYGYYSSPSEGSVWLSHENPVDTVEFVIHEGSAPTEYSCVIHAFDSFMVEYEFIEFGLVGSPERAVTNENGFGRYILDSPGTYSFSIYHDHDYFAYLSSPDLFNATVSDTEPSDTINILINPLRAITEQNKPEEFTIGVYPNPFNSVCNFDVPMGTLITVFDIYGRLIENIGINRTWSPSQNESGVYLVKFTFDDGEEIRRAIYIK